MYDGLLENIYGSKFYYRKMYIITKLYVNTINSYIIIIASLPINGGELEWGRCPRAAHVRGDRTPARTNGRRDGGARDLELDAGTPIRGGRRVGPAMG